MRRISHSLNVFLRLVAVALFLLGAAGQTVRECPYHATHGGDHAGDAGHARPAGSQHGGHGPRPAGESEAPRSPCSCIGTCHLTSVTPLAADGATQGGAAPRVVRWDRTVPPDRVTSDTTPDPHQARAPPLSA